LKSHIVDYRPRLLGSSTPTCRIRKSIYLHTQACVHAYVTFRFHRALRVKLQEGNCLLK
jgi:hypothetical protein